MAGTRPRRPTGRPKRTGRRSSKRRAATRRGESRRAWFLVGGVLLILVGIVIGRWTRGGPSDPLVTAPEAVEAADVARAAPGGPSNEPVAGDVAEEVDGLPQVEPGTALVSLVIDDLGRSVETVEQLADLGVDLSYSVLPFESRTPQVVERLTERRAEILLHLPMEASGPADPGPGSLLRSMDPEELRRRTRQAVRAVPGAVGANNHMGSALSSDGQALEPVLRELAEQGLFFLDSRTTAESVGFQLARKLGMPAAERRVFLDREIDRRAIRAQFHRLLDQAAENGAAIAIGHPHAETLEVLREEVPKAAKAGFRFVPVSYLLERSGVEAM